MTSFKGQTSWAKTTSPGGKLTALVCHHRHLSNIDSLMALFASLVLLMVPAKKKPRKTGTSSGHITNLKQSILETFNIYVCHPTKK